MISFTHTSQKNTKVMFKYMYISLSITLKCTYTQDKTGGPHIFFVALLNTLSYYCDNIVATMSF